MRTSLRGQILTVPPTVCAVAKPFVFVPRRFLLTYRAQWKYSAPIVRLVFFSTFLLIKELMPDDLPTYFLAMTESE